jgi:CRISPR-associated protein Cas6
MVDLAFRIEGESIAADHGYALYSALSRIWPLLHADNETAQWMETTGIHPISGRLSGDRRIILDHASSRLIIRLPGEHIVDALPLTGVSLRVDGFEMRIGVPEVRALVPAPRLYGRLVIIKGFTEPAAFLDAANRQLDALGIKTALSIPSRAGQCAREGNAERANEQGTPLRRTLRVKDKEIVGFALLAEGLTADESIRLQETGLGGRRRFGCGVFVPALEKNGKA